MAIVKAQDLRSKTADELESQLLDLKKEAYNLRFQGATGQLENPSRMRLVRREIARVKTVLGEKASSVKPDAKSAVKSAVKSGAASGADAVSPSPSASAGKA